MSASDPAVTSERWVNVTEECAVQTFEDHDVCEVWHGGNRVCVVGHEMLSGYRLRKVRVYESAYEGLYDVAVWALIVEQRQP